uniref:SCHIP-1 domain-containing protein n=1 Tax=Anopheles albimanus TaxID=7167 RepID=A0A182FRW3_ANOAL
MCTRIRKGIINPNYPGFQSLAYTLNEDNFYYSSENPSEDEEDSYVSESDDNEMKRQTDPTENDENGNTCDGSNGEDIPVPVVPAVVPPIEPSSPRKASFRLSNNRSPLYSSTNALSETHRYASPARTARLRHYSTDCSSPVLSTMTIMAEEKLDAYRTGTYACTPPDLVLQHSFDHRSITADTLNDDPLTAAVELSNAPRPDLIPERQLQLLELENKKNDLLKQQSGGPEGERSTVVEGRPISSTRIEGQVVDDGEANEKEEEEIEREDSIDIEGNRTPPSPAVEVPNGRDSVSNSDSCSTNFLRNLTFSPDIMLEDESRCYDSVTDDSLSDDSDQDTDEGVFEYRPYGGTDAREHLDCYPSPALMDADMLTPDSGGSEGSSPGEVQYHLVDDCSHQTVQITRSRRSNEHPSPTNQYHLFQQYATPSPTAPIAVPGTTGLAEHQTGPDFAQPTSTKALDGRNGEASDPGRSVSIYRKDVELPLEKGSSCGEAQNLEIDIPKVNPFCDVMFPETIDPCDFFTKQAKLQIEARMALCQAKDMAHMQMEIVKRSLTLSPMTKVVHTAVEKAGLALAADKRRLSRYYLTRLNVAQLQTILVELQSHAEVLNEELVQLLMERDDLHISQDATLIDIEDLSRYLCAKEQNIMHAERQRKAYHWKANRAAKYGTDGSMPSTRPLHDGDTAPLSATAYRYH